MVPARQNRRWNCLPRSDDHVRLNPLLIVLPEHPDQHQGHLRLSGAFVQRPYRNSDIPADKGTLVPWGWAFRRRLHRHRTRLHLTIGSRFLWQRGHCYLRAHVYILLVDQGRQNWLHVLGRLDCTLLLLHGRVEQVSNATLGLISTLGLCFASSNDVLALTSFLLL